MEVHYLRSVRAFKPSRAAAALLRNAAIDHARAWRALYDGAAGVVAALQAKGVETMLIKGGVLDLTVYPEDLPRATDDLDFLVKPPDLDLVVAELEAEGFVQGRVDPAQLRVDLLSADEKAAIAAQHYELAPFFGIVRLPGPPPTSRGSSPPAPTTRSWRSAAPRCASSWTA